MPANSALKIFNWLDWEETVLLPSVYSRDSSDIKKAVQHLQSALGGRSYLVESSLTLADIVVYSTLLPVQVSNYRIGI